MNKTIESINFNANAELIAHIEQKFEGLRTFYDRIIGVDIYLKFHREKDEDQKEVEVKVFLPGRDIFANAEGDSFEQAANKVFNKTKRQLIEVKEKEKNTF